LESSKLIIIPDYESPVMVIQVMQYDYDCNDSLAIDPLTAVLSIPESDKSDHRVEAATEEVLEEYLR
jgi:hypothetical protein